MTATPNAAAYSYIRFSTKEQIKGDSKRRQVEATAAWCERNKVTMDEITTYRDLGKSAYLGEHRRNPDRNALASFLKLVEDGKVPRGSYLILESLDRLTREEIQPALLLVLNMLQAGVRIVQLTPSEQVYDDRSEAHSIMLMMVELMRGHSESKMKSERVGGAWGDKKQAARDGKVQPHKRDNKVGGMKLLTHMLPFWVEERGGVLVPIPKRAAAVKRIFQLSAAGCGEMLIARRLTEEGVKPFGPSGKWQKAYVAKILRDRRAVGEYQPRRRRDGSKDGEPVPKYYPAIVSQAEWDACRGLAAQRKKQRGRIGKHVNLFQGLLKDARSGSGYFATSRLNGQRTKTHRVLINYEATEGRAPRMTFPADVFEAAILSCLREIDAHEILNGNSGPDETMVLAGELARVEASIMAVGAEMDANGETPELFKRLREKEQAKKELVDNLTQARQKAAHPLSESWGELQSVAATLANAPDPMDARLRLRSALRRIVDGIWLLVVPRGRDRLAAVQVDFNKDASESARRSYLILHRPPKDNGKARTPGYWQVRSWAMPAGAASGPEQLDLATGGWELTEMYLNGRTEDDQPGFAAALVFGQCAKHTLP